MPLLAERELDLLTIAKRIRDRASDVLDHRIIDPQAAALGLALSLAIGIDEASCDKQGCERGGGF